MRHWIWEPSRLPRLLVAGCVVAAVAAAASATGSAKTTDDAAARAETLTVLDAGGVLSFTKPMFEDFKRANPGLVSDIKYEQSPSTEAIAKIRVQQAAGRLVTDIVVSGGDVVGAGIQDNVWLRLLPNRKRSLPNTNRYTAQANALVKLADGYGAIVATEYQGPLVNYDPSRVRFPTRVTPASLLAWARANPNRFTYARPPSSGPGRQFLMALPYMLGDKSPRDPVKGWAKTWRYLKQLEQYCAAHPASTSETLRGLAQRNYDAVVTTVGWDLGMRASNTHPLSFKVVKFGATARKDARWTVAGHYIMVPKGLSSSRQATAMRLINFILRRQEQVKIYAAQNKAQPGPAVKGVTLANAPRATKQEIAKTNRPEYSNWIKNARTVPELDSETLAVALDRWAREVGR
jgi:putative spermidine/putrescine transport system substrate-binding protein